MNNHKEGGVYFTREKYLHTYTYLVEKVKSGQCKNLTIPKDKMSNANICPKNCSKLKEVTLKNVVANKIEKTRHKRVNIAANKIEKDTILWLKCITNPFLIGDLILIAEDKNKLVVSITLCN